jgi:hypothetical protein
MHKIKPKFASNIQTHKTNHEHDELKEKLTRTEVGMYKILAHNKHNNLSHYQLNKETPQNMQRRTRMGNEYVQKETTKQCGENK